MKTLKDYLFPVGLFVMAAAFTLQYLALGESPVIHFLKGFALGLIITGAFVLINNRSNGVRT